jgi:hypothetical protein
VKTVPPPILRLAALLPVFLLLSACGYHVAGAASALPPAIHTIAIPAFKNVTTQYRVSDLLASALTREFISRTHYRIVANEQEADAILTGAVVNFVSYPTIFDPVAGRATGVTAAVTVAVMLRDKAGTVLYNRPNFETHERYEISVDPTNYFDESAPAMQRLAQDVARALVTGILEKF